jgi:hypothetical protein
MRGYLAKRGNPLRVLLLIDARQSIKQSDRDFLLWLDREARVPLHVVMSKCDLVRRELTPHHSHPPSPRVLSPSHLLLRLSSHPLLCHPIASPPRHHRCERRSSRGGTRCSVTSCVSSSCVACRRRTT